MSIHIELSNDSSTHSHFCFCLFCVNLQIPRDYVAMVRCLAKTIISFREFNLNRIFWHENSLSMANTKKRTTVRNMMILPHSIIHNAKILIRSFSTAPHTGTSLEAIRAVVNSGKICVLNLHPQSLKLLRASDLKPYIVLVAPPSLEKLRQKKVRSGEPFKVSQKHKQIHSRTHPT